MAKGILVDIADFRHSYVQQLKGYNEVFISFSQYWLHGQASGSGPKQVQTNTKFTDISFSLRRTSKEYRASLEI